MINWIMPVMQDLREAGIGKYLLLADAAFRKIAASVTPNGNLHITVNGVVHVPVSRSPCTYQPSSLSKSACIGQSYAASMQAVCDLLRFFLDNCSASDTYTLEISGHFIANCHDMLTSSKASVLDMVS